MELEKTKKMLFFLFFHFISFFFFFFLFNSEWIADFCEQIFSERAQASLIKWQTPAVATVGLVSNLFKAGLSAGSIVLQF